MTKKKRIDKTMMVDVETEAMSRDALETQTVSTRNEPPIDTDGSRPGIAMIQLKEHFQAVLRSKTIFYPVAYRLAQKLGQGRQGVVFVGYRYGARACVTRHAIKIFDPSIYPDPRAYWTDMGRIAHQTGKLQPVSSPNLVSRDIYDETNGIGYMQMELIQGSTVSDLLNHDHLQRAKRRLSTGDWIKANDALFKKQDDSLRVQPGVAIYILRSVLRGLETLHTNGFVHCDIKPDNMMINRQGLVKVIDFGRAVKVDEDIRFLLGTPLYMAPETHRNEPPVVQTDLYSLGLVALELLCGRHIFEGVERSEPGLLDFKTRLTERLPDLLPPAARDNELLVNLLHKLLAPKIEDRFANAREAESSNQGCRAVHKQLTLVGKDMAYDRALSDYLSKVIPPLHE